MESGHCACALFSETILLRRCPLLNALPFSVRQLSFVEAWPAEILRNGLWGTRYRSKCLLRLHGLAESNACKRPLNPRYEALDG